MTNAQTALIAASIHCAGMNQRLGMDQLRYDVDVMELQRAFKAYLDAQDAADRSRIKVG